jgi:hypothetical protein
MCTAIKPLEIITSHVPLLDHAELSFALLYIMIGVTVLHKGIIRRMLTALNLHSKAL